MMEGFELGKIEVNKKQKKESLLNTAFSLFTSKGFQKTSISDIVNSAGVAKGTFYLYFSDKYDLRNKLIAHKAATLFLDAYHSVCEAQIADFDEQILHIVDYIILKLQEDRSLLGFISKHLSWGIFRNNLIAGNDEKEESVYLVYQQLLHDSGYQFRDPEIMIYLLIELVGGAIYNPLLYDQPASLEQIRPELYNMIRFLIQQHIITETPEDTDTDPAPQD